MRPSLLPNLIAAVGRNMARGFADLALFEVGPDLWRRPAARTSASASPACAAASNGPRHWAAARRAQSTSSTPRPTRLPCSRPSARRSTGCRRSRRAPPGITPAASARSCSGRRTGSRVFGEVHPRVLAAMDVAGPARRLRDRPRRDARCRRASAPRAPRSTPRDLQAVTRDFAFVVAADVPADRIVRAAKSADKALIARRLRVRRLRRRGDRARIGNRWRSR